MPSLDALDRNHNWVLHEFDRIARQKFGWCLKGVGVEHLFQKRPGALGIIRQHFDCVTLYLRSMPDRCLYGENNRFWLAEIKSIGEHPSIYIEASQLCYLKMLSDCFDLKTVYVFGRADKNDELNACVCDIDALPIEVWCETRRFREEWNPMLIEKIRLLKHRYYPQIDVEYTNPDPEKSSGDPFVVISRLRLQNVSQSLRNWFSIQGYQNLRSKDRVAWEGTKGVNWGRYPVPTTQKEVA